MSDVLHPTDRPIMLHATDGATMRTTPYPDMLPAYPPSPDNQVPAAPPSYTSGAVEMPRGDRGQAQNAEVQPHPTEDTAFSLGVIRLSGAEDIGRDKSSPGPECLVAAGDESLASPKLNPSDGSPADKQLKPKAEGQSPLDDIAERTTEEVGKAHRDGEADLIDETKTDNNLVGHEEPNVTGPEEVTARSPRELHSAVVDTEVRDVSAGIISVLSGLPEVQDNRDGLQSACYEVLKHAGLKDGSLLASGIGKVIVAGLAARVYYGDRDGLYAGEQGSYVREGVLAFAREHLQWLQSITAADEEEWNRVCNGDWVELRTQEVANAYLSRRVDRWLSAATNEVMHGDHPAMVRAREAMDVGPGARWLERDFRVIVRTPEPGEADNSELGGVIFLAPYIAERFLGVKDWPRPIFEAGLPVHEWFHRQTEELVYPFIDATGPLSGLLESLADHVAISSIPQYPDRKAGYAEERAILDQLNQFPSAKDASVSVRDRLVRRITVHRDMTGAMAELASEIGLVNTLSVIGCIPKHYVRRAEKVSCYLKFGTPYQIAGGMSEFRRLHNLPEIEDCYA